MDHPTNIKQKTRHAVRYFLLSPELVWIRTIVFLTLGLSLVLGISYLVNSGSRSAEAEDPLHVVDAELDSFERVLEQGNEDEIVGFLKLIKVANTEPLPIHIEKLNQAIALSDRLLEIGTDKEHVRTAQFVKLNNYIRLLMLHQKIDQDPTATIRVIKELAASLEHNDDSVIRKSASLSILYSEFAEFRQKDRDEQSIKSRMLELMQAAPDDVQLINSLIVMFNKYSELGVNVVPFLRFVQSQYADSEDPNVKAMVATIDSVFFNLKYKIPPLLESEQKDIKETYAEAIAKAQNMMFKIKSEEFVKDDVLRGLFQSVAVLFRIAEHDQIREIFKSAREAMEKYNQNETIYPLFKQIDQLVGYLGEDLPIDHLVQPDGSRYSLSKDNQSPELLLFVQAVTIDNAAPVAKELVGGFDKLILDKLLRCTVVFVSEGESEDDLWRQLDADLSSIKSITVIRANKSDNQKFFDQIAIPWSPCWAVITKDGKLGEFNPMPQLLRSRIVNYIDKDDQPKDAVQ